MAFESTQANAGVGVCVSDSEHNARTTVYCDRVAGALSAKDGRGVHSQMAFVGQLVVESD